MEGRAGHCFRLCRAKLLSGSCEPGTVYVEGLTRVLNDGHLVVIRHAWLEAPDGRHWRADRDEWITPPDPSTYRVLRTFTLSEVAARCWPEEEGGIGRRVG